MLPDPLHFHRICRICLSSCEKLVNLFDFEEDILSLLVSMTAISISSNDNLPQNICAFCSHQIKTTHYFILKCQESDRKLRLTLLNSLEKSDDSTLLDEENLLNDVIEYDSVEDNSSSQPESIGNDLILTDDLIENVPIQVSPHSDVPEPVIDESSIDTTRFMSTFCVECRECQLEFECTDTFAEHMKTHHQAVNIEYIEAEVDTLATTSSLQNFCDICNKSFATPKSLERHRLKHDSNKKTDFKCNVCGKQTKHINHFKIHMRCHKDFSGDINELIEGFEPEANQSVNKKQYICSICQRACSSRSNLAVHIRRHNGKMTNFCNICGKGYPRSTDLTVHMRQHTGEKPFVCFTCNRGFKRSDKLTIHMRTHTGERPYACSTCAKGFAQRNDLLIHQRRNVCAKNAGASKTEHHNAI